MATRLLLLSLFSSGSAPPPPSPLAPALLLLDGFLVMSLISTHDVCTCVIVASGGQTAWSVWLGGAVRRVADPGSASQQLLFQPLCLLLRPRSLLLLVFSRHPHAILQPRPPLPCVCFYPCVSAFSFLFFPFRKRSVMLVKH